jgi:antitoxin component of MazEF toxin-antitoxin module
MALGNKNVSQATHQAQYESVLARRNLAEKKAKEKAWAAIDARSDLDRSGKVNAKRNVAQKLAGANPIARSGGTITGFKTSYTDSFAKVATDFVTKATNENVTVQGQTRSQNSRASTTPPKSESKGLSQRKVYDANKAAAEQVKSQLDGNIRWSASQRKGLQDKLKMYAKAMADNEPADVKEAREKKDKEVARADAKKVAGVSKDSKVDVKLPGEQGKASSLTGKDGKPTTIADMVKASIATDRAGGTAEDVAKSARSQGVDARAGKSREDYDKMSRANLNKIRKDRSLNGTGQRSMAAAALKRMTTRETAEIEGMSDDELKALRADTSKTGTGMRRRAADAIKARAEKAKGSDSTGPAKGSDPTAPERGPDPTAPERGKGSAPVAHGAATVRPGTPRKEDKRKAPPKTKSEKEMRVDALNKVAGDSNATDRQRQAARQQLQQLGSKAEGTAPTRAQDRPPAARTDHSALQTKQPSAKPPGTDGQGLDTEQPDRTGSEKAVGRAETDKTRAALRNGSAPTGDASPSQARPGAPKQNAPRPLLHGAATAAQETRRIARQAQIDASPSQARPGAPKQNAPRPLLHGAATAAQPPVQFATMDAADLPKDPLDPDAGLYKKGSAPPADRQPPVQFATMDAADLPKDPTAGQRKGSSPQGDTNQAEAAVTTALAKEDPDEGNESFADRNVRKRAERIERQTGGVNLEGTTPPAGETPKDARGVPLASGVDVKGDLAGSGQMVSTTDAVNKALDPNAGKPPGSTPPLDLDAGRRTGSDPLNRDPSPTPRGGSDTGTPGPSTPPGNLDPPVPPPKLPKSNLPDPKDTGVDPGIPQPDPGVAAGDPNEAPPTGSQPPSTGGGEGPRPQDDDTSSYTPPDVTHVPETIEDPEGDGTPQPYVMSQFEKVVNQVMQSAIRRHGAAELFSSSTDAFKGNRLEGDIRQNSAIYDLVTKMRTDPKLAGVSQEELTETVEKLRQQAMEGTLPEGVDFDEDNNQATVDSYIQKALGGGSEQVEALDKRLRDLAAQKISEITATGRPIPHDLRAFVDGTASVKTAFDPETGGIKQDYGEVRELIEKVLSVDAAALRGHDTSGIQGGDVLTGDAGDLDIEETQGTAAKVGADDFLKDENANVTDFNASMDNLRNDAASAQAAQSTMGRILAAIGEDNPVQPHEDLGFATLEAENRLGRPLNESELQYIGGLPAVALSNPEMISTIMAKIVESGGAEGEQQQGMIADIITNSGLQLSTKEANKLRNFQMSNKAKNALTAATKESSILARNFNQRIAGNLPDEIKTALDKEPTEYAKKLKSLAMKGFGGMTGEDESVLTQVIDEALGKPSKAATDREEAILRLQERASNRFMRSGSMGLAGRGVTGPAARMLANRERSRFMKDAMDNIIAGRANRQERARATFMTMTSELSGRDQAERDREFRQNMERAGFREEAIQKALSGMQTLSDSQTDRALGLSAQERGTAADAARIGADETQAGIANQAALQGQLEGQQQGQQGLDDAAEMARRGQSITATQAAGGMAGDMAKAQESLAQGERQGAVANILQGRSEEARQQLQAGIERGQQTLTGTQAAADATLGGAGVLSDQASDRMQAELGAQQLSSQAEQYIAGDEFRRQELSESARRYNTTLDQEAKLAAQRQQSQERMFSFDQERQFDTFEIGQAMDAAMESARDDRERDSIRAGFVQNSQRLMKDWQVDLSAQEIDRSIAIEQISSGRLGNALSMGTFLADQAVKREGLSQSAKRLAVSTHTAIADIGEQVRRFALDAQALELEATRVDYDTQGISLGSKIANYATGLAKLGLAAYMVSQGNAPGAAVVAKSGIKNLQAPSSS